MPELLSSSEAAIKLEVTPRAITRYATQGMPYVGEGRSRRYPWPEIKEWRSRSLRRYKGVAAGRRSVESIFDDARAKKMTADALLSELTLAERRGELIPLALHRQRIGESCARLAAICRGTTRYIGDIQRALTPLEARAVAELIGRELLAALYSSADTIESEVIPQPENGYGEGTQVHDPVGGTQGASRSAG